jgi:hypothetical protein
MKKIPLLLFSSFIFSALHSVDPSALGPYHPTRMARPELVKIFELAIHRGDGTAFFNNKSNPIKVKLAKTSFTTFNKNGTKSPNNIDVLLCTLQVKDWNLAKELIDYGADLDDTYKNQNPLHIALEQNAPLSLLQKLIEKQTPYCTYPVSLKATIPMIAHAARYVQSVKKFEILYESSWDTSQEHTENLIKQDAAFALSFMNNYKENGKNIGTEIRALLAPNLYTSDYLRALNYIISGYSQEETLYTAMPDLIPTLLAHKDTPVINLLEHALDEHDYKVFSCINDNLRKPLSVIESEKLMKKAAGHPARFINYIVKNMAIDSKKITTFEKEERKKQHKDLVTTAIAKIKALKITEPDEKKRKTY